MSKNISKRLTSDLKFKIFKEQNGICPICKNPITEKSLLNRSTTVHLHHLVPRSLKKSLKITDKLYESRRNLTLLHGSCHLALHKTKKNDSTPYLRNEIPKYPITN
jgi:5-methylcytosine-specific restriction endonuclease McrA